MSGEDFNVDLGPLGRAVSFIGTNPNEQKTNTVLVYESWLVRREGLGNYWHLFKCKCFSFLFLSDGATQMIYTVFINQFCDVLWVSAWILHPSECFYWKSFTYIFLKNKVGLLFQFDRSWVKIHTEKMYHSIIAQFFW